MKLTTSSGQSFRTLSAFRLRRDVCGTRDNLQRAARARQRYGCYLALSLYREQREGSKIRESRRNESGIRDVCGVRARGAREAESEGCVGHGVRGLAPDWSARRLKNGRTWRSFQNKLNSSAELTISYMKSWQSELLQPWKFAEKSFFLEPGGKSFNAVLPVYRSPKLQRQDRLVL